MRSTSRNGLIKGLPPPTRPGECASCRRKPSAVSGLATSSFGWTTLLAGWDHWLAGAPRASPFRPRVVDLIGVRPLKKVLTLRSGITVEYGAGLNSRLADQHAP